MHIARAFAAPAIALLALISGSAVAQQANMCSSSQAREPAMAPIRRARRCRQLFRRE
jgi:hypothetical protein